MRIRLVEQGNEKTKNREHQGGLLVRASKLLVQSHSATCSSNFLTSVLVRAHGLLIRAPCLGFVSGLLSYNLASQMLYFLLLIVMFIV